MRIIQFFQKVETNQAFWTGKLQAAYELRRMLLLTDNAATNAYRLIHGEGDGLPGLIIDIYHDTAVIQAHSIGMHRDKDKIAFALRDIYKDVLTAVYDKSAESLPPEYL